MLDQLAEIIQGGNPLLVAGAGLVVGLVHALEPDHLGAVSTQVVRRPGSPRSGFAVMGALWGAGHTAAIVAVGFLVAWLSMDLGEGFFAGAELAAALMLIGLGVLAAARRAPAVHVHPHRHGDVVHTHPHGHGGEHGHGHRFYLIGCLHGLAGSGGLVALAAASMQDPGELVSFLGLFGAGSVLGMAAASGAIGIPLAAISRAGHIYRYVRYAAAGLAVAVGAYMVYGLV